MPLAKVESIKGQMLGWDGVGETIRQLSLGPPIIASFPRCRAITVVHNFNLQLWGEVSGNKRL